MDEPRKGAGALDVRAAFSDPDALRRGLNSWKEAELAARRARAHGRGQCALEPPGL